MNSFYNEKELESIGFLSVGKNVLISRKASFYGVENISIGNNVRIDDFCILSGKIHLGSNIHISAYTALYGGKTGIELKDYSGVSSRCAIYAESDDYSGVALTNPMVPDKYRNIIKGKVVLEKHVIIGTGSTILPNVIIGEGASVGSMSLVNKSLEDWGVYVGIPCKRIKERDRKLLEYEKLHRNSIL
jgi:galactoside O-acetyltransferase